MKLIGINFENDLIHFFKSNQRSGESFSKTVNRLLKEQFINNSGKQFLDDYSKNLELLVTVFLKYIDLLRYKDGKNIIPFDIGFFITVRELNLPKDSIQNLGDLLKGNFQMDIGLKFFSAQDLIDNLFGGSDGGEQYFKWLKKEWMK